MRQYEIVQGDCLSVLEILPDQSVHCIVTSPPYFGLRDYGNESQIGLEETPDQYVQKLVAVFREARRVLRDDGTLWLNLGDSYGKGKQLLGIPWKVAFALQDDGWILRQDIIWHKPNPMPESCRDRCTKSHEYIFLLAKQPKYQFDHEAFREPALNKSSGNKQRKDATGRGCPNSGVDGNIPWSGDMRNRRDVWTVPSKPLKAAHFATFPPDLIEPCILAGCPEGGIVLDPFAGAGTTGLVSLKHGRQFLGIELNPEYIKIAKERIEQ